MLKGLHVVMGTGGNPGHVVNGSGQNVQLHGVNHSYTEDSCTSIGGGTFADGHLTQADLTEMLKWKINVIRVPLNEDCWLGINGVPFGGAQYQTALKNYVNLITSNNMAVILDLHWAAPGTTQSQQGVEQVTMADSDHALTFWQQVATAYKSTGSSDTSINSMVLFDLYNEPNPGNDNDTTWTCWLKGGAGCLVLNASGSQITGSDGNPGTIAGMASMLKAVRDTGAQNIVMIGGIYNAHGFGQWLSRVNSIPALNGTSISNVMVSWHMYSNDQSTCPNPWNGGIVNTNPNVCPNGMQTVANNGVAALLSAGFPVLVGETGISADVDFLQPWFESALSYLDTLGQNYTAWSWNVDTPPNLITTFNYSGKCPLPSATCTAYTTLGGQTFYQHLQKF
jgi:hypothetical protein